VRVHSVGRIYWHPLKYAVKPKELVEKATTQEIEEPYRGGKGLSVRGPFTKNALVVGIWTHRYAESDALTAAIKGRIAQDSEIDWESIRFGLEEQNDS